MLTLTDLITDDMRDAADAWLCQRRNAWPAAADVWRFRREWSEAKAQVRADLLPGTYASGLLSRVTVQTHAVMELWSARAALVMQARSRWSCPRISPSRRGVPI